MSYYYNYYLAHRKDDGLVYPLGPFDSKGKLSCILCKSRSYASDLHEDFRYLDPKEISDELYDSLISDFYDEIKKESEDRRAQLEKDIPIKILPLSAINAGSLVKEGYVLSSQLQSEEYDSDDFYPILTPHVYAERLRSELGRKKAPRIDEETGEEYYDEQDDITNFIYHKWVNYSSKEYEEYMIHYMADIFGEYRSDILIIETEG